MPQFSEEWIEQVRTATDIVELVGKNIQLKQRGQNYVGLCPFHDEKTPSFNVNADTQLYYCFGCGAGGNVFNYVMNTQNVSFPESAKVLAQQAGIMIPYASREEQALEDKKQLMYRANYLAAQFYYKQLRRPEGKLARNYLANRGINSDLAKDFYLGYASAQWDGLVNFFETTDIKPEILIEAGLISSGKQGGYYDRFRERVIFPICDERNRFIGFGGRLIGDGQPKYLNSPETAIFHKSRILYGINWAKDEIKAQDKIVVVEGYTDLIALKEKGLSNVVASLGTAFSPQHANLIKKFTGNVVIAFDGDAAGTKATQRGVEILNQADLKVKVAPLKDGQDPDGFAQNHSEIEVSEWVDSAVPFLEYRIKNEVSQHDISTRAGKLQCAQELINILADIESLIIQDEYSNYVAQLLDIDKSVITGDLEQKRVSKVEKSRANSGNMGKNSHITTQNRYTIKDLHHERLVEQLDTSETLEASVMWFLLTNPDLIADFFAANLGAHDFMDLDYQHLFNLLLQGQWDKHGEAIAQRIFTLPEPTGKWYDYLEEFRTVIWCRELKKIEENLEVVENNRGADVLLNLCNLIKQYYGVRREILIAREKG